MRIEIPDFCVVMLIGASGSGKSSFASRHFTPGEILSSDVFRQMVADNPEDQDATNAAFDCLYYVAQKRMDRRKLVVIDATGLKKTARRNAVNFAKANNCFSVAIVLNVPEKICKQHNAARRDRQVADIVIERQCAELRQALKTLKKESFRYIHVLSPEDIPRVTIGRVPLWTDRSGLKGPFDLIGDVHGCYEELCNLLEKLNYTVKREAYEALPPAGRTAIFLGDLCDRGPASMAVLRLAMNMSAKGHALCVPGNHEDKLLRHLEGKKVSLGHGLETTLAELEREDADCKKELIAFLRGMISHYLLDEGRLVAVHAGLPEKMQARSSAAVREFCLYGQASGELDAAGLPERLDWTCDYHGDALVAYAHTPTQELKIVNNTICLDGGCVFGGCLAALRYPEMETVTVPAQKEYVSPLRPFAGKPGSDSLDIADFLGRKHIVTQLGPTVTWEAENSLSALESMSRYAVDPRWLIYLPPTMSPCESSSLPDYLEYPEEAFTYYKKNGVARIICEEKHMGSRAVIIVARSVQDAAARFGIDRVGVMYTRTGRPFFARNQKTLENELLNQLRETLSQTSFWEKYQTGWVCLDCEILPWSWKAHDLIALQYASYGQAGSSGLHASLDVLARFSSAKTCSPHPEEIENMRALSRRLNTDKTCIELYNKVWQSYCKHIGELSDIKVAPFHILATEERVWLDVSHPEHLQIIDSSLAKAPWYLPTRNLELDLEEPGAADAGIAFWQKLLADGAEGMVVKPRDFIHRGKQGLLQPAIKCRGREYLRIIYGAAYTERIADFKKRQLAVKRSKAIREFALGMESLERFIKKEPLRRIHECVFGIMALENEPVDARL